MGHYYEHTNIHWVIIMNTQIHIGLLLQIQKYTLGYYYKYTNTHWVTLHTYSSTSEILKT